MNTELLKELKALALELSSHDGGLYHYGDEDDVGLRACCDVLSYRPHAPDCIHSRTLNVINKVILNCPSKKES